MKKTIKVIDLLNMIANREIKKSTKIKFQGITYTYDFPNVCGIYDDIRNQDYDLFKEIDCANINDKVEILEEDEKPKEIELLDIKCENERTGNCYILNENGTKCFLTKHSKMIVEQQNKIAKAVNYLLKKEDK